LHFSVEKLEGSIHENARDGYGGTMNAAASETEGDANEKHGRGELAAALAMIDCFASVGVTRFDLTHTNIDGEKRGFRPKQSLADIRTSLPFLLESAPRRQNNIIIRPHNPPAALLVQLDDLKARDMNKIEQVALLTIETSPGNAQAWIAVSREAGGVDADFARRVRKAAGADPSASGATRVAGTVNYKARYAPDFPTVRFMMVARGRILSAESLQQLDLVAAPEMRATQSNPVERNRRARGRWPDYQYCLERAPLAHSGEHADVSRADFAWCMTAIDWGWTVLQVAERLLEESVKARENGTNYAHTTAKNAALAIARRRGITSLEP
jgi:hypothetical protein